MVSEATPIRVHLVAGGFPPGSPAGHDMDYARLRILQLLQEQPRVLATVGNDFNDLARWLPDSQLLITYVAGPFLDEEQNQLVREWLAAGGRWLALHGTSGGRAIRVDADGGTRRKMVKTAHHETLGAFFINHPPMGRFKVNVTDQHHPLTKGLPESFEVMDELYMIEMQDPDASRVLLTTELAKDPSPPGFGFVYDKDTALQPDGKTRVLGYTREVGKGGIAYIALGHCHSPMTNRRPVFDPSVNAPEESLRQFRGPWETGPFQALLRNGVKWGSGQEV